MDINLIKTKYHYLDFTSFCKRYNIVIYILSYIVEPKTWHSSLACVLTAMALAISVCECVGTSEPSLAAYAKSP